MVKTFLESKLIHYTNKDFICENNIYQAMSFSKVYPKEIILDYRFICD